MQYKIAVIQIDSKADKKANLEKLATMIDQAAAKGAEVISCPEHCAYFGPESKANAESLENGEAVKLFSQKAAEHKILIHGGSLHIKSDDQEGRPYNMSLLFDKNGKTVSSYVKTHLFNVNDISGFSNREADKVKAGDRFTVYDAQEYGRFGFSICYDSFFPEIYRILFSAGAEVIFIPANYPTQMKDQWQPLLQARAIENSAYVVAAAQCGKKAAFDCVGHSMIIEPSGKILAEAGTAEEIIMARIDTAEVAKRRKNIMAYENRRNDLYDLRYLKK